MCVCKYLNQRVRKIGEQNGKYFKGVSKIKKRKKHVNRMSFITQFKIEFLLPFTGCKKVLGKMPVYPQKFCYVGYEVSANYPLFLNIKLDRNKTISVFVAHS